MFTKEILSSFLFFDLETIPLNEDFYKLPERLQNAWSTKFSSLKKNSPNQFSDEIDAPEAYYRNCSFYSEYSRVICISFGVLVWNESDTPTAKIKSFANDDEKVILSGFKNSLTKFFNSKSKYNANLCGHNIKEFDVPFLARRLVIQGMLPLPPGLDIAGKKPWEVPHVDTLELWKFGDWKSYIKLDTLTAVLDVESPKHEIDGSMVADVYYKNNDLDQIQRYCEDDVIAVMRVMLRFSGMSPELEIEKISN